MGKLSGKVAVVTGASKGIGAGIAERLAADGASVVVNYSRSAKEAEALVAEIAAAGGKGITVQADISRPEQIKPLFDAALDAYGKVDILVNNAGVYEFAPLEAVTPESIDRLFNLNVKGLILATQAAVRVFPAEGGVVVNISSIASEGPAPMGSVYSSTKGAVDVLTQAYGAELGARKIRVVGIAPGATNSDGTKGIPKEMMDSISQKTPLGRMGEPADIAAAVSFVVSEDGGWVTGTTLQVGGGLRF